MKPSRWMCFGEHIGQLISGSNRTETKSSLQKMMAHKMTLNMFSTFMKYIIMRNLNCTSIVTKDRRTGGLRNPHIIEKPTEPEELKGCSAPDFNSLIFDIFI
jgi:hypothetical protein